MDIPDPNRLNQPDQVVVQPAGSRQAAGCIGCVSAFVFLVILSWLGPALSIAIGDLAGQPYAFFGWPIAVILAFLALLRIKRLFLDKARLFQDQVLKGTIPPLNPEAERRAGAAGQPKVVETTAETVADHHSEMSPRPPENRPSQPGDTI